MTLYSVFDRRQDEAPAVVPDRFSWFAALLPPVFMVVHGLWLELVGFALAVAAIVVASGYVGADAGFWFYVLLAVLAGWEAGALRRRGLRRAGFIHRGEIIAPAADLAQVEGMRRRGRSS